MTRPTCPRCRVPLLANYDELVCLAHGTMYEPSRAYDAVESITHRTASPMLAR